MLSPKKPPPPPATVLQNTRSFFEIPFDGGLVIARADLSVLFALNPVASEFWRNPQLKAPQQLRDDFSAFLALPADPPLTPALEPADQPVWSADFVVHGTPFRLNLQAHDQAKELSPRLSALRLPATPVAHTFSLAAELDSVAVFLDGALFAREPLLAGARAVLLQEITRLAVPGRAWRAILHAGACWSPGTGCIILAGASFSGKSTLCVALMEAGWLCYSDDSACLTPDFEVAGMPFALALREGERFRPSNLNGQSPVTPATGLVFVDYQPGAKPIFDPLGPFEAFVELQRSGFWVEHTEAAIASFLGWLSAIRRYRLTYSVLADAVHLLGGL